MGRVSHSMESGSDLRRRREGEMFTFDSGFGGKEAGAVNKEAYEYTSDQER